MPRLIFIALLGVGLLGCGPAVPVLNGATPEQPRDVLRVDIPAPNVAEPVADNSGAETRAATNTEVVASDRTAAQPGEAEAASDPVANPAINAETTETEETSAMQIAAVPVAADTALSPTDVAAPDPASASALIAEMMSQIAPLIAQDTPSPVTARLAGTSVAEVAAEPPGRWLAMAGLQRALPGWAVDQETGVSVQVELRPLQGDGIDRISLEALLALGIDQVRLVIVDVYYDSAALRAQN